jgi:hypothetical protein
MRAEAFSRFLYLYCPTRTVRVWDDMRMRHMQRFGWRFFICSAVFAASVYAQESDTFKAESGESPDDTGGGSILPVARNPVEPKPEEKTVNWRGLATQSYRFLVLEHMFRIATEPGTRQGMKGPFFPTYLESIRSLHGWADGDPFYVNYVGHPMMGAIAGRIWEQNDHRYREVEFGASRDYWKSRLRASAFSFAYSAQFELGPISEASIGKIQRVWPQQGFVDLVVTPVAGLGWTIAEDALDKYIVRRIERRFTNPYLRMLVRSWANPSLTLSNVLAGNVPWYRANRGGVFAPDSHELRPSRIDADDIPNPPDGVAPFEFNMSFQPQVFPGTGASCMGGNGSAAFRIGAEWQLVAEAGGCKMVGLPEHVSGDSLTYMLGPRWKPAGTRRLSPHLQLLVGGQKVTQELFSPEQWSKWENTVTTTPNPARYRNRYVQRDEANAFALSAGGGLDLKLNDALALRLANLEFRHAWMRPVNGIDFGTGVQFSTGLVLRMGTW